MLNVNATAVIQDKNFELLFQSNSAIQLLHNYFCRYKVSLNPFELKIAKEFPDIYIQSIRLNQVYLRENRIDFLCNLNFEDSHKLHQKVWKCIHEEEQKRWNYIYENISALLNTPLTEILCQTVIWLEESRFKMSNVQQMTHLGSVYSFFVEYLFSEFPEKRYEIKEIEPLIICLNNAVNKLDVNDSGLNENPVFKILPNISIWVEFKDAIIIPYSFDLNIEPQEIDGAIFLNQTPESYYHWKLDGERYAFNQNNYINRAKQNIEVNSFDNETEMLISACTMFLSDLQIRNFQLVNVKVDIRKGVELFLEASRRKLYIYMSSFVDYAITFNSWVESYSIFTHHNNNRITGYIPFLFANSNEFRSLISFSSDDLINDIFQIFGFESSPKLRFNRFNLKYNVWTNPLLKINDRVFCPDIFFAENQWIYSFAQNALSGEHIQTDTKQLEKYLGEEFEKKDWKVKITSDKESNLMNGDVDIFVEDENALLYIQLKRPSFRLNLKDAYNESINSDLKAYSQLNLAEEFLSLDNPIYEAKSKPIKWIVSTSFENIQKLFYGCRKINYFEILNVLRSAKFQTLSEFISIIENDKLLKNTKISLFTTHDYRMLLISDNELNQYNELFNNAVSLNNAGLKEKARKMFEKCIQLKPNDIDAYSAIANIYADLGMFNDANDSFRKALEITPNDPYTSLDFSLTLMEGGKYFDGLNYALDLFEKYQLFPGIDVLFTANFIKYYSFLNIEEKTKLLNRWNNLK